MWSSDHDTKRNAIAVLAIGLSLIGILLAGTASGSSGTSTTYDNVQVFIAPSAVSTTTFSCPSNADCAPISSNATVSYSVSAYNSTGGLVASYQSPYPAASFELPGGSYIFTASVNSNYPYACPQGVAVKGSTAPPSAGVGTASGSGASGGPAIILPPCYYGYDESQYGFAAQKISGPTTVQITTQQYSDLPTTTVTAHVTYVNGTAAAGATVYASILGGQSYGYGCDVCASTGASAPMPLNMSGVVGSNGVAALTVPAVPVELTAWNWVPVPVPTSQSSVTAVIGGEKVNVTVYWSPSYVGLAGSALIVPPQTSASIVLHVQQPDYWVTPAGGVQTASVGVSGAAGSTGTVANSPGLVPSSVAPASSGQSGGQTATQTTTVVEQIAQPVTSSPSAPTGISYETVLLTIAAALALALASASIIMVRRKSGP